MFRHVTGTPNATNLVKLPQNLFSGMHQLTAIHFGHHPSLEKLPSFQGLSNLKSMTFADLSKVTELPAFEPLVSLERLELLKLSKVQQIPSFAPFKKLLYMSIHDLKACCNGVLGTCDLSSCDGTVCLDGSSNEVLDAKTRQILNAFNATVCPTKTSDSNSNFTQSSANSSTGTASSDGFIDGSSRADVDVCNGTLYRECNTTGGGQSHSAICYNDQMQVIACMDSQQNIDVRKAQILRKCGLKCDPVEEKWLGCTG